MKSIGISYNIVKKQPANERKKMKLESHRSGQTIRNEEKENLAAKSERYRVAPAVTGGRRRSENALQAA